MITAIHTIFNGREEKIDLIWIIFVGAVLNWLDIELSMIFFIYFLSVALLGNYHRVKD